MPYDPHVVLDISLPLPAVIHGAARAGAFGSLPPFFPLPPLPLPPFGPLPLPASALTLTFVALFGTTILVAAPLCLQSRFTRDDHGMPWNDHDPDILGS